MDIKQYINKYDSINGYDFRVEKYNSIYDKLHNLSDMDKHIIKHIAFYIDMPIREYNNILESIYNDNEVYSNFVNHRINRYSNSNICKDIYRYNRYYKRGLNRFMRYVDKLEDFVFFEGTDFDDNIQIVKELVKNVDF